MNPNDLPFIDSHIHFWDPHRFRYRWLEDLPALKRPFLPADFAAASKGNSPAAVVFVEGGCDPAQSLEEVDWAIELARAFPRLKGVVAHAPLENGAAVRSHLAELAQRPLVKGVRRLLQAEQDPAFCLRRDFLAGVSLLAEFGFGLDLCVRHDQLPAVTELVRHTPQVSFVLDHCGKPNIRGGGLEPWALHLEALAARPNVTCKLSGLTTEANWQTWTASELQPYLARAIHAFGFDRILFGGDWPVATLATDYRRWFHLVKEVASTTATDDLGSVFHDNARRVYRLPG